MIEPQRLAEIRALLNPHRDRFGPNDKYLAAIVDMLKEVEPDGIAPDDSMLLTEIVRGLRMAFPDEAERYIAATERVFRRAARTA